MRLPWACLKSAPAARASTWLQSACLPAHGSGGHAPHVGSLPALVLWPWEAHGCPPGWWASAVRFSFLRPVEGAAGQGARQPVHLLRPALAPGEGRRRSVPVLLNLLLSVLPTLLPLVHPFQLVGICSVWEGKLWRGGQGKVCPYTSPSGVGACDRCFRHPCFHSTNPSNRGLI